MKVKTIVILLIISISISVPYDTASALTSEELPVTVFALENQTPTYYAVDIPSICQEHSGSCGAAALKSAFGQLGYSLEEGEIQKAAQTTSTTTLTGDMVRAAHFSNASVEGSGTVIQGWREFEGVNRLSLVPGAGGTVSLPRRIGRQRTAWLALSGERIDAERALAWGIFDELLPGRPSQVD